MKKQSTTRNPSHACMKIKLYIMSLMLLFLLIFLLTIYIPLPFLPNYQPLGSEQLLLRNILPIIAIIMIIIGFMFMFSVEYKVKGTTNPPHKITKIKNENYEYLTFLTTYIIPLICIDLTSLRYIIILLILLTVIGYIFVKMDLYYGNPTLALLGYRLYKIDVEQLNYNSGIIIITRDIVAIGSSIEWIELSSNVWFVKECK